MSVSSTSDTYVKKEANEKKDKKEQKADNVAGKNTIIGYFSVIKSFITNQNFTGQVYRFD